MIDIEKSKFYDIKIVVIGNSGTDKTQYVHKWTKKTFNETYKQTIVSEFGFKVFENEGKLYRIQLWDLAGQENNCLVGKIFTKDSHGLVIMSDATNIETREYAIKYKKSIDDTTTFFDGKKLPCILVENKIDLLSEDEIDDPTFEEFWKSNGFTKGFRVSSKTGENIDESMEYLIKNIIKRMEKIKKLMEEENIIPSQKKLISLCPEQQDASNINIKKKKNDRCYN